MEKSSIESTSIDAVSISTPIIPNKTAKRKSRKRKSLKSNPNFDYVQPQNQKSIKSALDSALECSKVQKRRRYNSKQSRQSAFHSTKNTVKKPRKVSRSSSNVKSSKE